MFNISEFKSRLNKHGGPARTSLFEVSISPFNVKGQTIVQGGISTDDLRFFCQTVTMPGINLEIMPYRPNGLGFPEFMPMDSSPDQLNCVFMLDSNHRVMTYFHRWISSVVNVSGNRGGTSNGLGHKLIEYKENYAASELTIRHYSTHNQNQFYECKYLGVYPTQVSPIDLSWAANDAPATLTVNFSYNKIIYQGFSDSNFDVSQNFLGSQTSIPRGRTIPEFISGFNQRIIDLLTVV
jgi:hypothetical protein